MKALQWATQRLVKLLLIVSFAQTLGFHLQHDPQGPSISAASRRTFLAGGGLSVVVGTSASPALAIFSLGDKKERRQKELCLVNLLRLQYWARTTAQVLETSTDSNQRKNAYLEARLGAKAMVAKKQKIGGGATPRVFSLLGLEVKECLDDLKFYAKNKRVDQMQQDLIESLASIVEFDGLETTQDPSPRSSLTLGQYNEEKAVYVRRMLAERVDPLVSDIVDYFGPDTKRQCEGYVKEFYPNELPPTKSPRDVLVEADASMEVAD